MNLRKLARITEREGKALALKVRRGEITRGDVEKALTLYPTDLEPRIALGYLDRWGIR